MRVRFRGPLSIILGTLTALVGFNSALAQSDSGGGLLDEITVTAQRREQSLQEVPISIEAFTGAEIHRQGYRDLNELANFSPSVYIDDSGFLSQDRSIRGVGTFGNALTLEQAVPIFVDGIHFGRPSQVKLAFLDTAQVEILKGPQPVFFGMNATAGAFNIVSAAPTDEWEGYLDTEFSSHSTGVVRGAYGGPLSDNWGIRVAGTYESADGHIKDIVTNDDHGGYENIGGRIILQFAPQDNFTATFKYEYADLEKDPEAVSLCRTDGPLVFGRDSVTRRPGQGAGNERSIWDVPNIDPVTGLNSGGSGWSVPHKALSSRCFGDTGASRSGPFFAPPVNIHEENSDFGSLDVRAAVDEWIKMVGVSDGLDDVNEKVSSSNGYIDLNYEFANGVQVNLKPGWSTLNRANSRDNSDSPFFMNFQNRGEDFDQYSTELRFTSSADGHDLGAINVEWMLGLFWQRTDLDIVSNSPRASVRRGLRFNESGEDQEWNTAFATVTLNFTDRFSLDLGGRTTDLDKTGHIAGLAAEWVYDVRPCDPDGADPRNPANPDPATCALHEDALQITAAGTEFLLPGADASNLWIIPWRDSRDVPLSWTGGRATAVGLSTLTDKEADGPYGPSNGGNFDESQFTPQVTVRYRAGDNHSLFLRYAESFKAGGFDTGVTSIPGSIDDFRFESESADSIELGSKGVLWGGRARYDVTLFETTFDDLQVASDTGNVDDPFVNINAGQQQVTGVEFSITAAVTDRLTLNFGGALMDGEMTDFPNAGCTTAELENADSGPCVSEDEAIALGIPDKEGTIDRTGTQSPKTPDWKFVVGLDYEIPIANDYLFNINAKGYASDSFITDPSGFSLVNMMNQHEDLNLTFSLGPQDGSWDVAVFGRNLLEARLEYNPEFDIFPNGQQAASLSRSDFRSFGVKFRYNFSQ